MMEIGRKPMIVMTAIATNTSINVKPVFFLVCVETICILPV